MKYPKIDLLSHEDWQDDQCFVEGDDAWLVHKLWEAAKDLPIYDVPLVGMCTDIQPWDGVTDDYLGYLSHVKLIMDADLSYPIILTPNGVIADGRHRLGKAIVTGQTTIKVQRLPFMPEPDFVYDDDGNPIDN